MVVEARPSRPVPVRTVGVDQVRPETLASRRRLYLLARVVVARYYRQRLTLDTVAGALASSPRQLQRAYAQFGRGSFQEDLLARRMKIAAGLLADQPAIPVRDVARLVGYRQAPHFARVFRQRYGVPPARFREQARAHRAHRARSLPAQSSGRLPLGEAERPLAAAVTAGSETGPAAGVTVADGAAEPTGAIGPAGSLGPAGPVGALPRGRSA